MKKVLLLLIVITLLSVSSVAFAKVVFQPTKKMQTLFQNSLRTPSVQNDIVRYFKKNNTTISKADLNTLIKLQVSIVDNGTETAQSKDETLDKEKQALQSILIEKINSQISQANSLADQVNAKQEEINTIINDYNKKIETQRNGWASKSSIAGRIAMVEQEKQSKLVIPYQELQTLTNQYNTLTGNPISLVIPQKTNILPQYMTFYPDSTGGGDIYDTSGTFHIRVEKTTGVGYTLYY